MTAVSSGDVGGSSVTGSEVPTSAVKLISPSAAVKSAGAALATIRCLQLVDTVEARLGLRIEALPDHQRDRVGVLEVIGDLVGREQHVERHHRRGRVVRAEVRDGELRHVGQHQRDVLTGLDAELDQAARELLRQGREAGRS